MRTMKVGSQMTDQDSRTVALMSDQITPFGFVTTPIPYPRQPDVLIYQGEPYIVGPSGGGGGAGDIIAGHPEIEDGYVKASKLVIDPGT
jgi:hypothetical protein